MSAGGAEAQYFGRNKIQYEDFDFEILETDHFKIYHYPEEATAVADAARMAERWYSRYSAIFAHEFSRLQPLIFYANHADFQQTNVISGMISQGVGGVTERLRRRIVIPLAGTYSQNDHVIGHGLVHAFQFALLGSEDVRSSAAMRLPLWFIEGMAEFLSVGRSDPQTAMWMYDALLQDDLPTLTDMTRSPEYFPYRYGHAFWSFVADGWSDDVVVACYLRALPGGWSEAPERQFAMPVDSLSKRWHVWLRNRYGGELSTRTLPEETGQPLVVGEGQKEQWQSVFKLVCETIGRYV
jgi:hypothetical protein